MAGIQTAFPSAETWSPRSKARIAGIFYLLNIVTGSLSLFFLGRHLQRYGDAANFAATAFYLVVTFLFYELFKPVSRSLSLLAALLSLLGCGLGALGSLHFSVFNVSPLIFFGAYCLLIGYLIFNSTFMPRAVGVLMMLGGLGWLTFLSPHLARSLAPFNLLPGVIGELALTVWLLVAGLHEQRWQEQGKGQGRSRAGKSQE